jgi:hypothetical protein
VSEFDYDVYHDSLKALSQMDDTMSDFDDDLATDYDEEGEE